MSWKTFAAAAIVAAIVVGAPAARVLAAQPDEIVGTWESESNTLKLEFFNAGPEYNARLLWGNRVVEADGTTFKQDALNPDPSLRSRSLKGILMVKGLVYQNGEWTGGTAYDASSGRTYDSKAEIVDGKLHMRGYIGVSLLGQTVVFRRVASAPPLPKAPPTKR